MYQHQSKSNEPAVEADKHKRMDLAILDDSHWSYIQRRYHLSPRETQVAKLICQGLVNDEVAKQLKIKNGTVKTHLRNVYRRIHVRNKITMLLKFISDITYSNQNAANKLPIPIMEILQKNNLNKLP